MFVDLTHVFEDGMPGFRLGDVQYTARIRPFLTHEDSRPN